MALSSLLPPPFSCEKMRGEKGGADRPSWVVPLLGGDCNIPRACPPRTRLGVGMGLPCLKPTEKGIGGHSRSQWALERKRPLLGGRVWGRVTMSSEQGGGGPEEGPHGGGAGRVSALLGSQGRQPCSSSLQVAQLGQPPAGTQHFTHGDCAEGAAHSPQNSHVHLPREGR